MMMRFFVLFLFVTLLTTACTVSHKPAISPPPPLHTRTLVEESRLQQGERYFEDGYYKKAMRQLLPLACDGIAEAQYAVGYMYYYGLGVGQDTEVGYIWIQRSASQHYLPAIEALHLIHTGQNSGDKIPHVTRPKMTQ